MFLGTGMRVEVFQMVGIDADLSQKMEWRGGASSMAQSLSTLAEMLSGPGAFPALHLLSCRCTSSVVNGGCVGVSGGRALRSSLHVAEWSCVSKRV